MAAVHWRGPSARAPELAAGPDAFSAPKAWPNATSPCIGRVRVLFVGAAGGQTATDCSLTCSRVCKPTAAATNNNRVPKSSHAIVKPHASISSARKVAGDHVPNPPRHHLLPDPSTQARQITRCGPEPLEPQVQAREARSRSMSDDLNEPLSPATPATANRLALEQ